MIFLGSNEIAAIKLGNTDISAIYAGDLLIWPTSVTGWSVSPAEIEMEASGGTENIRITSLSAWTISSSESWITFSQNSGDSGRTTVVATIASHTDSSARTATITVTDGTNVSTIPVTQNAPQTDYSTQYLTIEITSAGYLKWYSSSASSTYYRTIQYSKDNGSTWSSITSSNSNSGTTLNVSVGDKILFKSTNNQISFRWDRTTGFRNSTAGFITYGNVLSLIYGDDFIGQTTLKAYDNIFGGLFRNCTGLTDASNLILLPTTLRTGCYRNMFQDCKSLVAPPKLSATTLGQYCYTSMFTNCTSLTTAPDLPAATLQTNCYEQMFINCSNLTYIKCLATNISASSCLSSWVSGVAASGTFVKAASMTSWPTGTSGIPSGWTVVNNS